MIDWSPRDYQRELILAMQLAGYKRACLNWHRRCLASDTLIRMWNGSVKFISDLVPGDRIVGVDHDGIVCSVVKNAWESGIKPTGTRLFGNYQELQSTEDHRIAIIKGSHKPSIGYVKAKDLNRQPVFCYRGHQRDGVIEEKAKWFGLMLSDGSFLENQCPSFTCCKESVKESFLSECSKCISHEVVIDPHGSGWRIRMPSGYSGKKGSNEAKEILRKFCGLGKKEDRSFPSEVWNWDQNSQWKFIEGLLEGDGNLYFPKPNKKIKNPAPSITFNCGKSFPFAFGLLNLLQSLGVMAQIQTERQSNHKVRVYRHESVNKVLSCVSVCKWPKVEVEGSRAGAKRYFGCGSTTLISKFPELVEAMTWDIETSTGNFFANDILVHNSGKDFTCWMHILDEAIRRPGIYYYVLPTYRQGKKAIWDAIGNDGKKFLDYIPKSMVKNQNQTEMKVRFTNDSILQVVGGDDADSLRGTNPRGVVLSEFSRTNPAIWDVILRPILAANHGWAIINSTPNGRNHFKDLFETASMHPEAWYASSLTVDDTHVVAPEIIEQDRREGMSEDMVLQEYYVSFNAGAEGAYYAKLMEKARDERRIGYVPYDRSQKVYTAWDLGYGDATAIIFFQLIGREVRVIDYYENSGEGLEHYAKVLQNKDYAYKKHFAPHDVSHGSLQTGVSLLDVARGLDIHFDVVPRLSFSYGIEQARITLPFCYFDEMKCKRLIKCLDLYRKKYNKAMELYLDEPLHDATSHAADAFRMLACARAEIAKENIIDPNEYNAARLKSLYGYQHDLPRPFQQPHFGG